MSTLTSWVGTKDACNAAFREANQELEKHTEMYALARNNDKEKIATKIKTSNQLQLPSAKYSGSHVQHMHEASPPSKFPHPEQKLPPISSKLNHHWISHLIKRKQLHIPPQDVTISYSIKGSTLDRPKAPHLHSHHL
jgi:hypothetical protein